MFINMTVVYGNESLWLICVGTSKVWDNHIRDNVDKFCLFVAGRLVLRTPSYQLQNWVSSLLIPPPSPVWKLPSSTTPTQANSITLITTHWSFKWVSQYWEFRTRPVCNVPSWKQSQKLEPRRLVLKYCLFWLDYYVWSRSNIFWGHVF